ncbi:sugar phosphate isomerase/epimerase family protein [Petroclostridium sp. X23]|uniref:sugar phosphate isomerase/epimerase family protein n=1 Tax=Petroclostridium sp. X23 TaxID=3045146 RepID=UPI0024ADF4A9|nr:sugar phosphate isomerase/epimerase family protein [Petroclostridium sp. X23]WHH60350.1 sugar phosphate isomerase/epimerase family protein [Petroclostridium sp. X23]
MKLCYQVATPDVAISPAVTAFQGDLEYTFGSLGELGYDGVELMTLNPLQLDWDQVKKEAEKNKLDIALVCTGEIFGQLNLSFMDKDAEKRAEARKRVKEIIDFAAHLGAIINIGRVRGQFCNELPREVSYGYAIEAFKEISDYGGKKNVKIALENVTLMQTNFINTIEEAVKVVKDVDNEYFKIMMDVFHMNIEEKNMFEMIEKYAEYNIHVHLADNNRRYPGHCGLDFEKIINAFKQTGYDGAFCTEIFQIPDQETAARGAMEHLRPILNKIYK